MITYYFSLNSPWTYFGHQRLIDMAALAGVPIRPYPVNFGAIFDATGGLPVPKRSKERQDYRFAELERWRTHLSIDLKLQPAHWPADDTIAANIVVNLRETDVAAALTFAGAIMRAIWAEDRNIADKRTVEQICDEVEVDFAAASAKDTASIRERDTRSALAQGVFGAPSYIYQGELYWGQDRLDFVERALTKSKVS